MMEILGLEYSTLLDSGAKKSVIGGKLAHQIISNKLYKKFKSVVRTADGQTQSVTGTISIPLTYNSINSKFKFLIEPSIQHSVISGMDFCETFDTFIQHSFSVNEIESKPEDDPAHIYLSNVQKSKLKKVIDFYPSFECEGIGLTRLIEHNIDTSTAKPIKQRFNPSCSLQ